MTVLAGLGLGESLRWHDHRLWLADWVAGEILTVDTSGDRRVVAEVPSLPISIDWTRGGRLVVVAGSRRALLRQAPDGALRPWVDLAPLADRPWNEIVVDGRGNVYVNTIGFDLMTGEPVAPGSIAVVDAAGVRMVAGDLEFPNGMVVTPDGSTLIVAESYAHRLTAFDIAADGALAGRRVWADLGGGVPDGLALDAAGAVWYADVPNQRCVRVAEGGEVLQVVELDRGGFACALGGPTGTTLFVAAAGWGGAADVGEGERTGVVYATTAPVPRAGRREGEQLGIEVLRSEPTA